MARESRWSWWLWSVVDSASKLELQAYVHMIELNVCTHLCHLHSNFPLAFALLLSKQSDGRRHLSLALSDRRMRGETSGGDSEEPYLASSWSDVSRTLKLDDVGYPNWTFGVKSGCAASGWGRLVWKCLRETRSHLLGSHVEHGLLSGAESLRSTNDVLQDRPEIEKKTYPRSLCVTTSTINCEARHYHVAKNKQHKNHHYTQRKVLSFLPTSIADPVRDHGNKRYREVVYMRTCSWYQHAVDRDGDSSHA